VMAETMVSLYVCYRMVIVPVARKRFVFLISCSPTWGVMCTLWEVNPVAVRSDQSPCVDKYTSMSLVKRQ
jgi:hypothetical protein